MSRTGSTVFPASSRVVFAIRQVNPQLRSDDSYPEVNEGAPNFLVADQPPDGEPIMCNRDFSPTVDFELELGLNQS